MFEQFLGIFRLVQNFDQVAYPAGLAVGPIALLVGPVRGEAIFIVLVHTPGADLDFHPHIIAVHQRRVDRLVTVALGCRDIILEPAGDHFPFFVQDAQRAIAFGAIVGDHPEGHDVGQLFKADVPLLHLAPDRIGMFLPAADFRYQPAIFQRLLNRIRDFFDLPLIPFLDRLQPLGDGFIGFGFHVAKGEQLHLAHIFIHADPLGQRRINIHGFMRYPQPFFRTLDEMQRPHIVQAVGKLDQQDADIIRHGEQEFAEILGCSFIIGLGFDL